MSTAPDAPARRPRIADWIREHRIVVFFVLVFVVSWWSWPLYAVGLAPAPFFEWGPLIAAVVVIGITEGRRGYLEWGARLLRWRVGWVWWVVALGTPLVVLAVASAANVVVWGAPGPVLAQLPLSTLLLFAALRFVNPLDGPLGEEPGWRGYALPELQSRRSPLAATLVLAPIVALWHLPLVTSGKLAPSGSPLRSRSRSSTVAVQPHRRQRAAHPGLPRRPGHLQLRRARFHGRRRGPDGLARRRAVVRARGRPGGRRPRGVARGTGVRRRAATGPLVA